MENQNNKEYVEKTQEERIDKVVRRTLSSEVKNGIVIATNEDKNGSISDFVVVAKGKASDVISMMTMGLIKILYKYDISLDKYVGYLQLVATSIRKEGGMK